MEGTGRPNRQREAEFKQLADAAAADKRFKDQTAAPGNEAAVRRIIEELRTGQPSYDLRSTNLATATRQFENGSWEYRISMAPDGKGAGAGVRPLP